MDKKLAEKIYKIGLFAGIPASDEKNTIQAVRAVATGGMAGVILSWNKHLGHAVEQLRKEYPQLLIAIQGPYTHSMQLFASGANFVVDTAAVPEKTQVPFLFRKGNDLLDGERVLAQCSNKVVFVSDIKQQRWADISARAQQTIAHMLGFELRHIGINHSNAEQAENTANAFEKLFGWPKQDKGGAYFAANYIEAMKKMFYGTHGHIAVATNHVDQAVWYLERLGVQFNWKSADYNPDKTLRVIYLKDEIGGFAVHLIQK